MSRPKDLPLSFELQEKNLLLIKQRYETIKLIANKFPDNNFVRKNWSEETITIRAAKSGHVYIITSENVNVIHNGIIQKNNENLLKNAALGLLQLEKVIFASIAEDDIKNKTYQDSQDFFNLIKDEDDKKTIINFEKKITDDLNEPLFFLACDALNIDLMNVFLQNGIDINAQNQTQESALHKIVCSDEDSQRKFEAAKFLIEQGANPDLIDDEGYHAYEYCNLETEEELYKLLGGEEVCEIAEEVVGAGYKNKRVEQVKRFGNSEQLRLNFDLPKIPINTDSKPKFPSKLKNSFSVSRISKASPNQERT